MSLSIVHRYLTLEWSRERHGLRVTAVLDVWALLDADLHGRTSQGHHGRVETSRQIEEQEVGTIRVFATPTDLSLGVGGVDDLGISEEKKRVLIVTGEDCVFKTRIMKPLFYLLL